MNSPCWVPHFTEGDRQRFLKTCTFIYKNSLGNFGLNLCNCKLQLERFLQIKYYPIRELKNKSE